MKETFIIRTEWAEAIFDLSVEEQATIFQNMFYFHMDKENLINLNNLSVKLVWKLLQPNLERNIAEYDRRRDTSRENGAKGGRPPKSQEVTDNSENLIKPNKPNVTLSVLDSVLVPAPNPDSSNTPASLPPTPPPTKKSLSERKEDFKQTLVPYVEKYGRDMLNEFFKYWTESNKSETAFRYEGQKFWDLSKRLTTWHKNQKTEKTEFASNSAPAPTAQMQLGRGGITFTPRNHVTNENDI